MANKTVGIIGGMGPEATIDLMNKVIKETPAMDDIDHIRMIVDNNPKVPSRIKALIEETGESPLSTLQEMAKDLVSWGADILAMPCNTAHYYHDQIQSVINVPLLNMIELTAKTVMLENTNITRVGILSSTAVVKLKLYEQCFNNYNIDIITPDIDNQEKLMQAIKNIKKGKTDQSVINNVKIAASDLVSNKSDIIVIACTELSIIRNKVKNARKQYDSSQELAKAIVYESFY